MVEITDYESAKAWLETQERQTQVWFAARCALRALPGLGLWHLATISGDTLKSFRAALITAATATCQTADVFNYVDAAASASSASALDNAPDGSSAAATTISASLAAAAAAGLTSATRTPAGSAAESCAIAGSVDTATADARAPNQWGPLWGQKEIPEGLIKGWAELKKEWVAYDPAWSFWIEWYEAILNGTPLPWELTQRIALEVTPEEWNAGPGAVATKVEKIRAAYDVQWRADELAQSAYLAQPATRGIGDNKGPSLDDDDLGAQPHETIIWVAASELREQARSESRVKSTIKRALSYIIGVLKATGLWIAGTVATGISIASVTVVKQGADAWAVQNQDKLVELIDATLRWLSLVN